ncbi:DUF4968 domain-containing protein [Aestuariibacter sp. AA17]|uniref:DUF4968 domain-containing protein n=1 Tax=Fluctibacter corallii TaxID=2984329 RepID=A0ABT3A9J0_9ALTE|nr:TIM-barrel domain-containing protein [Aestuariibacter sp. AA17]MCV2885341.1 DUF4968 domain-containing protein [Aestuariibacter sp. AA17]
MKLANLFHYKAALTLFVVWLFAPQLVSATEYHYLSHAVKADRVDIETSHWPVTIRPLTDNSVEVHYAPEDNSQLPSFALADVITANPSVKIETIFKVTESENALSIELGYLSVKVTKSPFHMAYYANGKLLTQEESGLFYSDTLRGFRFALSDEEKLLGGGQRVLGMNRRGHRMPLYNRAHYGYGKQSNQMYYSLPGVISTHGYSILFDNSAKGTLDIGSHEENILQFSAVAGRTAYIVVAGETMQEITQNMTDVTGKQPLPPRWALGNFASRFGYRTEAQTRSVVEGFRKANIPLDAIVLDLYWFGPDIKGHMGNLEWDRNAFPTPERMIEDLAKEGVKTVMITEPFVLTTSQKWQEAVDNNALALNAAGKPKTYQFYFGETGLIDVFSDSGKQWFNQAYQRLAEQGVHGWWGDLGEPEVHPEDTFHKFNGQLVGADEIHNVYGHIWAKNVYEASRKLQPESRPFIMMRSGFLGTQRYGIIPWTGDVARSWEGLSSQVELALQMGAFGLAYTHSDLGGFAGGEAFDQALYLRWLQYGVFQPVFRPHAQENIAPEPIFHDSETIRIARDYINLRYQLLPYNYSLAYENSLTGKPLMRSMSAAFPDNTLTWFDETQQYMWGDAFLVRPIVDEQAKTIEVTLPKGQWYQRGKSIPIAGNQTLRVTPDLDTLPVYIKGGEFIPMSPVIQSTDEYKGDQLVLHYYLAQGQHSRIYRQYEDGGNDVQSIATGQYQVLTYKAEETTKGIDLLLSQSGEFQGAPSQRQYTLVLHGIAQPPKGVKANGELIQEQCDELEYDIKMAYCHNAGEQQFRMKVSLESEMKIEVNFKQ